jgi:hypothetical protein
MGGQIGRIDLRNEVMMDIDAERIWALRGGLVWEGEDAGSESGKSGEKAATVYAMRVHGSTQYAGNQLLVSSASLV